MLEHLGKIRVLQKQLEFNVEHLKHIPEARKEWEWCREMLWHIKDKNYEALTSFDKWCKIGDTGTLLGTDIPINPASPQRGTILQHQNYKLNPFQTMVKNIVDSAVRKAIESRKHNTK